MHRLPTSGISLQWTGGHLRYICVWQTDGLLQIYLCNEQLGYFRYCYNRQINRLPQVFYRCNKPYRLPQVCYLCNTQMDYLRYDISATHKRTTSALRAHECLRGIVLYKSYYYVISATHKRTTSGMLSLQHTNGLPQVYYFCNTQMDYLR